MKGTITSAIGMRNRLKKTGDLYKKFSVRNHYDNDGKLTAGYDIMAKRPGAFQASQIVIRNAQNKPLDEVMQILNGLCDEARAKHASIRAVSVAYGQRQ